MSYQNEDQILVQRAKENAERFEFLYQKYSRRIYYYFWYRVGHKPEIAEDLTQETFLRAFRNLSQFESRNASYAAYLMTIAHNLLVDFYRKPAAISIDNLTDIPNTADEEMERLTDVKLLWRVIDSLQPTEKSVIRMKYQEDLSTREIARKLTKTENAVRLILLRARKKLAQSYA